MTPTYTQKNRGTNKEVIYHYHCSQIQMCGRKKTNHANRIPASEAEQQILRSIQDIASSGKVIDTALQFAQSQREQNCYPQKEALFQTKLALRENQEQTDRIIGTITSGAATQDLLDLGEKATLLRNQKRLLQQEHQSLTQELSNFEAKIDGDALKQVLCDFSRLVAKATPEEIQQVLRLIVRRIEWFSDGWCIEFYRM